jgi:uncharacterized protein (TIGR03083 family)
VESASKQSLGLPPVLTAHLLPKVDAKLLELLRSLDAADWDRPTIVPGWKVRDIVAHLLDTALRKLSVVRDRHFTTGPKSPSPEDVRAFVDAANADGIRFYGKLSAPVLVTMMERASKELCDFSLALDPYAPATFPVSWAGESESQNWFDTARELTERWHHQQQIRLAAGHEGIMTRELYHPVLDTFMRALPFSYRDVAAPAGTRLQITVTGACGGHWHLVRGDSAWIFTLSAGNSPAARLEVPQEIAWRIFTKGIARPEAESRCGVSGDPSLTEKFFSTLAIVG